MTNAPSKGIAQTLQDVLTSLQKQLKEKTIALEAANKKINTLSGGQNGDFTAELDKEKEKRAETEALFKEAKAEISQLKKDMKEASSNGKGDSSAELIQELEKRTQAEKDLAARTAELAETEKSWKKKSRPARRLRRNSKRTPVMKKASGLITKRK